MKKYLAVFVAPIEAYDAMKTTMKNRTAEDRQKEMDAWMRWMKIHEGNIVDHGGGVGAAKRVSEGGEITDVRNEIGGYMIIQAGSADEAAAIFTDSPHFGVEGGAIEVMEIIDM